MTATHGPRNGLRNGLRRLAGGILATVGAITGVADRVAAQTTTRPPDATATTATTATTASVAPTTTVRPRADGGITATRVLAEGSLRFTPPPLTVRPRTTRAKARSVADGVVPAGAGRPVDVFFALFSATSPARRSGDGRLVPVFDQRPVWVVRYTAVKGQRQTGVIVRRAENTAQPTTSLALTVLTDVVVVIDDATASEVLRTEYAT